MLARFVDRSRLNGILVVLLGISMPLAFPLAGGAAALYTLRRSVSDGLVIAVGGWAVLAALMMVLGEGLPGSLLSMLGLLLASVSLSRILVRTGSLGLTVVMATGLALALLGVVWLAIDDPVAHWRGVFATLLEQLAESGAQLSASDREQLLNGLQLQAFTGNVMATLLLVALGSVFIGRSWQAQLVNPGGFQREFRVLRIGRGLAVITAVLFMITALTQQIVLLNIAAIVLWLWVIQGLAVIHGIVAALKASAGWLAATYALLIFGWSTGVPVALVVPLLGMINQFIDLRGLVARNSDNGD